MHVRTRWLALVAFSCCASALWGQGARSKRAPTQVPCGRVVARNPQGNYIIPGTLGDVEYREGLTLDAYAPSGEPRPAALVIHGSRGNKRGFVTRLYEQLTRAGYAWFAPNFHDEDDVAAALSYVRCPGRFNITKRMILVGEDTGARIALRLAATGNVAGVAAVGAKLDENAALPEVPVLMIQGQEDQEWPIAKAEAYCRRLKNGRLYAQKGAQHVFENWLPAQWDYREELDAWLRNDRRGLWKDITYARPQGLDMRMDAYIPEGAGPFAAVIIAHGGGWEGGDKITYVAPLFEPLAKAGIAWFSIDYRLLPYVRNPDQIEDMRIAIRYVKTNAARYHVDPNRIAIMGESASGQIVTLLASLPCTGCEVQAVVSFYGVYDFTSSAKDARGGARAERMFGTTDAEVLRQYSPIRQVHRGMPPVLLLQGAGDRLISGTREYAARLEELGVPHELVVLEGAPHGIENWEDHPEWAFWKQTVVDWLKATLH